MDRSNIECDERFAGEAPGYAAHALQPLTRAERVLRAA